MKQYIEQENGGLSFEGMSIPKAEGNRHYRQAMEEVEAGEAKIIPFDHEAHSAKQAIEQTNAEARGYLASTDWYVVRFQETGEPIPAEVSIKRQEAREAVISEGV